jgi:hypothetical protein
MNKQLLNNYLRRAVLSVPDVVKYLSDRAIKALGGYEQVRGEYWADVYDSVEGFLTNAADVSITGFKNSMYNAMNSAFQTAAELGYVDGGGEVPLDADTQAWLDGQINAEKSNISNLFSGLRENWQEKDAIAEAFARADGYAKTLDAVLAEAKMRGSKNVSLEFGGDDGDESCPDCQGMKGKRHKIAYILANNLIPRPGNDAYECKGYRCEHFWFDPKTGEKYKF